MEIKIKGQIRLVCTDAEGKEKWDTGIINNTITNAGLAELANLAGDVSTPAAFTYLAVGTDNTAPAASQTALQAEITDSGLARASATVTRQTTNVTNDTLQLVEAFSVSGTKTVEEAGIFNAASSGTMLGRALTSTRNVYNGDTLTLTYKVIFA